MTAPSAVSMLAFALTFCVLGATVIEGFVNGIMIPAWDRGHHVTVRGRCSRRSGGMSGMVAGWIVSIALFVVCGSIAFVLARIVYWLDRVSTASDASEPEAASTRDASAFGERDCHGPLRPPRD